MSFDTFDISQLQRASMPLALFSRDKVKLAYTVLYFFAVQPPKHNPGEGQDQMAFTFKIFGHSK
jgi:hypothetical protein